MGNAVDVCTEHLWEVHYDEFLTTEFGKVAVRRRICLVASSLCGVAGCRAWFVGAPHEGGPGRGQASAGARMEPKSKQSWPSSIAPFPHDFPFREMKLLGFHLHVEAPHRLERPEGPFNQVFLLVHSRLPKQGSNSDFVDDRGPPRSEADPRFNQDVVVHQDAAIEAPREVSTGLCWLV